MDFLISKVELLPQVECSDMAERAKEIVETNGFSNGNSFVFCTCV